MNLIVYYNERQYYNTHFVQFYFYYFEIGKKLKMYKFKTTKENKFTFTLSITYIKRYVL